MMDLQTCPFDKKDLPLVVSRICNYPQDGEVPLSRSELPITVSTDRHDAGDFGKNKSCGKQPVASPSLIISDKLSFATGEQKTHSSQSIFGLTLQLPNELLTAAYERTNAHDSTIIITRVLLVSSWLWSAGNLSFVPFDLRQITENDEKLFGASTPNGRGTL